MICKHCQAKFNSWVDAAKHLANNHSDKLTNKEFVKEFKDDEWE